MTRYLAEAYLSRAGAGDDPEAVAARAHAAADAVSREGMPVRCLRSIFVPDDETWFLLFDAPSPAAVESALARAGLPCERVLEALTDEPGPPPLSPA